MNEFETGASCRSLHEQNKNFNLGSYTNRQTFRIWKFRVWHSSVLGCSGRRNIPAQATQFLLMLFMLHSWIKKDDKAQEA